MIEIVIDGNPVAKGRPRFSKYHAYTPKKTLDYEELIRSIFKDKYPQHILYECPLRVHMVACMKIPVSLSNNKKIELEDKYYVKKPDCDNLAKSVLDALNGICFKDDSLVVVLNIEKRYSVEPRLEIKIWEL